MVVRPGDPLYGEIAAHIKASIFEEEHPELFALLKEFLLTLAVVLGGT